MSDELVQLGKERLRQMTDQPKMAAEIVRLTNELAAARSRGFNTPEYGDLQRRCCDACNENADLRKLVGELRAEIVALKGGGFPPPGYQVPKPVYEE